MSMCRDATKCVGCKENEATMDLIYGELTEQVRVPWCSSCKMPRQWDLHPLHHAEEYINGKPKLPKAVSHAFVTPTKEQLEREAVKRAELKKEIDAPLYNRQPHYEGGIDPITFGQDNLSPEEMNGFYKMNVIKYVARCDRKNGLEDLQKARDYLNLLIKSYEDTPKTAMTDEQKLAVREAALCYQRVIDGHMAIVKRKDVLEELEEMLQDVNYTTSICGDGEIIVELSE